MKSTIVLAAALMLGASAPALAQNGASAAQQTRAGQAGSAAAPAVSPSPKARPMIVELQKAVIARDAAAIPAKVAAAQAVATTKEDRYLIGKLQLDAAVAANDNAGLAAAVDAIAASGYQSPAEVAKLYSALGTTFYSQKQYGQAAAVLQKASALDPTNGELFIDLGEARFALAQPADAVAAFQRAIALKTAGGGKADEALYKRALGIAYQSKLPSAIEMGRAWAAAYPGPQSWHNAIGVYRNLSKQDVEGTLDLLRLMQAAGALTTAGDYALFAQAAAEQSNFNEAQAVIDAGIAAKVVDPAAAEFKEIVSGLKTARKSTRESLEEARKMSPAPAALLRIGDRYYAMGDYAEASEVYREVLAKPGADAEIANLHLGMALARSGDKAGASAALGAVTGSRADIAKYWLTYVRQTS